MLKKGSILIYFFVFALMACDNEVDLNADFEDTTVVYSLINAYDNTHYVRVNRAYIEPNANAIELAANPDNFNYSDLDVKLVRTSDGSQLIFQDTILPKADGLFSSERNKIYFSTANLLAPEQYDLIVTQPDGKVTSARFTTLRRISLARPSTVPSNNPPPCSSSPDNRRRPLVFVDQRGQYADFEFIVGLTPEVARAQISLTFFYDEQGTDGFFTRRSVDIPVGEVTNPEGIEQQASIVFDGETFYRRLSELVPNNGLKKNVPLCDFIVVNRTAVDRNYEQYRSIYGPLDGLAQVRPEFTNVVNGIGLVSSRSSGGTPTFLDQPSRSQLLGGTYTRNLGFSNP